MSQIFHPGSPRSGLLVALIGCLAGTTMVWLLLSDSAIAAGLWPPDIHQAVVGGLGGSAVVDPDGTLRTDLPWAGLLIRIAMLVCLVTAVSVLWHRTLGPPQKPDSTTPLRTIAFCDFVAACHRTGWVACSSMLWLLLWLCAELAPNSFMAQALYLAPGLWLAVFFAGVLTAATCAPRRGLGGLAGESMAAAAGDDVSSRDQAPDSRRWTDAWFVALVVCMLVWVSVSFWMNERLYAGLWIPHGDSAMYEEHLWNVWHGKGFRSYLDQGLFLGEHLQVIHLLLLPVHMLWPSLLMMELAESVALGICVIPIYSMALRYSGSRAAAAWLGVTWLLYFPMHFLDIAIDLKTLRPGCYGLPFLFWGIDLAERGRLRSASLCLLVALSAQEDFALVTGSIGAVLWWNARPGGEPCKSEASAALRRWALGLGVFSVMYVLLAVLVVIPWFRAGVPVHYSRYFGDLGNSPGDLIRTTLQDPLRVLQQFLTWRTLLYVLVFAAPLGFLVFRSPVRLCGGAATFVMLSLMQLGNSSVPAQPGVAPIAQGAVASVSSNMEQGAGASAAVDSAEAGLPPMPYHHFHAPLLPVLFWAAAAGLAGRRGGRTPLVPSRMREFGMRQGWRSVSPRTMTRFAALCALFSAVFGSMMPVGAGFWSDVSRTGYSRLFVPGPRAIQFARLDPRLPRTARIASTDYVHTRLTHCERSYDYSDYLRAVNGYQPGVPADTDLIVIDTRHPYSSIQFPHQVPELIREPGQWLLWEDTTDGYFLVLERRRPDASQR